jgi:hypothetical protein
MNVMTQSFVLYLAVWTIAVCSSNAALTFHLENAWAFHDAASSSLVFKDTRGEIDGTQVSSLGVRTVNVSTPAPQHEILGDLERAEQQSPFHGSLSPTGGAALRPDVGDRETLVNLAKASGDAYSPSPSSDGWYDIDGANWASVLLGELGSVMLTPKQRSIVTDGAVWMEARTRRASGTSIYECE